MSRSNRLALEKVGDAIIRVRYLLLAACAGAVFAPQFVPFSDYDTFSYGGQALLGHIAGFHAGLHIYAADPELQIGPAPLAFAGVVAKLLPYDIALYVWVGAILALGLVAVRALELVAKHLGYSRRAAAWTSLLGGACVLAAWSELAVWGHLEEAAAIALIVMAVAAITNQRQWWIPGLLLGTAAMCKPWGLVAFPLLLALPRKDALRAGLTAAGVIVVCWLPFEIAAPNTLSALGAMPSRVWPHSTLRLLGFTVGGGGPKSARMLELALGASLGTLAVLRRRWLAVPLVGLSARALLDPRWFIYYGVGLLTAAVLWDIAERRRFPLWTMTVGLLEFVVQLWLPSELGAVAQLITVLAITTGVAVSIVRPPRPTGSSCRDCVGTNCICGVHTTSTLAAA